VAQEAIAENQKGNLAPSTGSFYFGMLKGDMEAASEVPVQSYLLSHLCLMS